MDWPKKIENSRELLFQKLKSYYPDSEVDSIVFILFDHIFKNSLKKYSGEDDFSKNDYQIFVESAERLLNQEPIQYITEEAHFYGRDFYVYASVLIPRGETEELVVWIRNNLFRGKMYQILDIGTGSGCIPISLEKELEEKGIDSQITSLDVSEEALKVARKNAELHHSTVQFIQQDILQAQPDLFSDLDVIVSNPPYIRDSEKQAMHANVLDHEPQLALFVSDDDPLIFYRQICELATRWLKKGGWLYFEINEGFGKEMIDLMESKGFTAIELKQDLHGKDRMVRGKNLE